MALPCVCQVGFAAWRRYRTCFIFTLRPIATATAAEIAAIISGEIPSSTDFSATDPTVVP